MTQSFAIRFLDRTLTVNAPASIGGDIAAFFELGIVPNETAGTGHLVVVSEEAPGRYALTCDGVPVAAACRRGDVIDRLTALAGHELPLARGATLLDAAAVGWEGKTIVILGGTGSGKSSLAAWFVEQGFSYVADADVGLLGAVGVVAGFPGPLSFPQGSINHVGALSSFHDIASVVGGKDRLLVRPELGWLASNVEQPCGLVIVVGFRAGAALALEAVSEDEAARLVRGNVRKPDGASDADDLLVASFAARVPALRLAYGAFDQIAGVADFLARSVIANDSTPAEFSRFLAGLPRPAQPTAKVYPVPERTQRTLKPKVTIGMATYDDYDGVYFSLQAIRMYHREIVREVEFLVVDNRPDGPCSAPLKALEKAIPNYRYLPLPGQSGTSFTRDLVFHESAGRYVLCMDCHVFIVPGALRRLFDYFDANPDTGDLLQGPMINDDLRSVSTHFEPVWREGMYGVWAHDAAGDDPDGPPFDIPMQGLGLFASRREAWPGFNPLFRGFGGEEGYIHEKVRQAGGRTLCLPFLRWMHRFARPMGTPYPNIWEDRIRNYVVGWRELGLSTEAMEAHFSQHLGAEVAASIFKAIERDPDIRTPSDAARRSSPLPKPSTQKPD